jgi:hypothetical protein
MTDRELELELPAKPVHWTRTDAWLLILLLLLCIPVGSWVGYKSAQQGGTAHSPDVQLPATLPVRLSREVIDLQRMIKIADVFKVLDGWIAQLQTSTAPPLERARLLNTLVRARLLCNQAREEVVFWYLKTSDGTLPIGELKPLSEALQRCSANCKEAKALVNEEFLDELGTVLAIDTARALGIDPEP